MKMAICMFRFLFDIKLGLPEMERFNIHHQGITCIISTKIVKGSNITSYSRDNYSWITKNKEEDRQVEEINISGKFKGDLELLRCVKYFKNRDIFSGGLIEPSSFTIFEILFEIPNRKYLEKEENMTSLKEKATKILVYFIDAYRLVSQESDVYVPAIHEAKIFEVLYSDSNFKQERCTFSTFSRNHYWGRIPRPDKEVLSPDKINKLSEFLKNDTRISIHERLLLDAKEQSILNKNYEVSILKINTAFEVFMQNLLINACHMLNYKELPVGRGKLELLDRKNCVEAILEGSIVNDLLKKYLYIILGSKSITTVSEYNKWHEHTYEKRNKIIHGGLSNISEEDAMLAFKSTTSLINKIIREVNQVLMNGTRSEIATLLRL